MTSIVPHESRTARQRLTTGILGRQPVGLLLSRRMTIDVPGSGLIVARGYDDRGRPAGVIVGRGPVTVDVPAGGFVVAVR